MTSYGERTTLAHSATAFASFCRHRGELIQRQAAALRGMAR